MGLPLPEEVRRCAPGRFCVALGTKRFEVMKKLLNLGHRLQRLRKKNLDAANTYRPVSIGVTISLQSIICLTLQVEEAYWKLVYFPPHKFLRIVTRITHKLEQLACFHLTGW